MKTRNFLYLSIPAALSAGLWSAPAMAGGVPAGTLIENTAQATYDIGGGTETIDSNTVELRVDELLDVAVTSLNSGPIASDGGDVVLSYSVTNTGNGPEAYDLAVNPAVGGNDFDPTINGIAVDTNGNGVYDDGIDEILTGPEQTAELAADEVLKVFVLLSIPSGVVDGNEADVDLLAEAVTGTGVPGTVFAGAGVDGSDAVAGPNGADDNAIGSITIGITTVDLVKSAVVVDPFGGTTIVPGSIISYTLTASVTGSGTAAGLVVTDPIPDNTTYQTSTLTLDTAPLTDAADGDVGQASDVDGISVDLGDVAGGTTHSITFDVAIDE